MKSEDLVLGRTYNFKKNPSQSSFFYSGTDVDAEMPEDTAYCFTFPQGNGIIIFEDELNLIEEINIYDIN